MAKDIDDLLRDVFGGGRGRPFSTQTAETYLQQSKKMNDGLDLLEKQEIIRKYHTDDRRRACYQYAEDMAACRYHYHQNR